MRDLGFIQIKFNELISAVKLAASSSSNDDLGAIKVNTANTKNVLDSILTELKEENQLSETIWYDRTDVTKFYIRKNSINQDTGVITISFQNIDGSSASPIIANLVQATSINDIEIISTLYDVIVSGTGYSIGDTVEELKLINTTTSVISYIYYNKNTNNSINPSFSSLQLQGKYITPNHLELLSSVTSTLPANTYKSISMMVMEGSCNIGIEGVFINNFPTNYSEVWGNGTTLLNKAITISTNTNSRVVINTIK